MKISRISGKRGSGQWKQLSGVTATAQWSARHHQAELCANGAHQSDGSSYNYRIELQSSEVFALLNLMADAVVNDTSSDFAKDLQGQTRALVRLLAVASGIHKTEA